MDSLLLTVRIERFHAARDPSRWTETFHVQPRKGMNLLEGLLRIRDEQDGTLSFRYSCRGAVCGSCAMLVNGQLVLACRTPVESLLGKPVLIKPLPSWENQFSLNPSPTSRSFETLSSISPLSSTTTGKSNSTFGENPYHPPWST
jgi:succinate dehydrogenase/fumarate reductase iron-sulfur protein